ncbi:helix-turn-helix transcriptional regulator [Paenibacillus allorhizosphaerae]|uniref:HTH deoR-type domain-containing protein n=1 Tax=Paenibacillus allorhizosphaerae TaxID=2849866 RepID=A0ABM8VDZ5_9BACL|nr:YafY family protein [Paenibacillus allorhizosphaerae]CAG7629430.1 hypothetical protein PAECIP111802_01554 [Paenibacillus allorhizosphaerae]
MSKSKRLMELMIAVNKRRRFTVRELAEEFNVSARTIMRDLQVLGELGLPLYAEYGPYGGYRVLNERMLPPIMFSEQEAVAMFFAYQSLQHYGALPFNEESVSALNKFYYYLPDDTKLKIDKMKQRVVFWTPKRPAAVPHLKLLLDAALQQRPLRVVYESKNGSKERTIQPIGVYSYNGFWYCPSYCFLKEMHLSFRVDRVLQAEWTEETHPKVDLSDFTITDWFKPPEETDRGTDLDQKLRVNVRLTAEGVRRCRWEAWFQEELKEEPSGEGQLTLYIQPDEIEFFSRYFVNLGADAVVLEPQEMVDFIRHSVARLYEAYGCGVQSNGDKA